MRNDPSALMLFAAGFGTRMGAMTEHRPKPLIPVAGRSLIDHALYQAGGIDRVVVNLHYRPEMIRAHLADRTNLVFSPESETILETGGGLLQALPLLGPGPVYTLNTDAVWTGPRALATLAAAWRPDLMDGLLLLVPPDRAVGHTGKGDFLIGPEGRLTRGAGLVYSGAQIVRTDGLAAIGLRVFSLNRLWDRMIAAGRLYGVVYQGGWCDVGRPDCIPLAEAMLTGARDV